METRTVKWPDHLSTAEKRAYQQLCDPNGRMLVLAIDQRNAMRSLMAPTEDVRAGITTAQLGEVKADLVQYLGNHGPAVLLDPECALPMVVDRGVLARDVALVVGMDASGWEIDPQTGLRHTQLVAGITPRKVRQLGGTAAKMLYYMRPDREGMDGPSAQMVRMNVCDCEREDMLLVVELLVYKLPDETAEAYEDKKPELILKSARLAVECGARVLKIQYPGSTEASAAVTGALHGVPWAMLSAGADHQAFLKQLRVAVSNGAAGAIAGRAIWKDCVSIDPQERISRLEKLGVPRLLEIQSLMASL